jgi:hypothetical protein
MKMPGTMPAEMSREARDGQAPIAPAAPRSCNLGASLFQCLGQSAGCAASTTHQEDPEIAALREEIRRLRESPRRVQTNEGGRPTTPGVPRAQEAPEPRAQVESQEWAAPNGHQSPYAQSSPAVVTANPFGFSSKEIEALRTSLEPDHLTGWYAMFLERVGTKSKDAQALLGLSQSELAATLHDPEFGRYWSEVDSELSTLLVSVIDGATPHAKVFYSTVSFVPGALSSGNAIARIMMSSTVPQTSSEYQEREDRLSKNSYFKMGMPALEAAQASMKLRNEWSSTSAARCGLHNDLLSRLINSFPPSLSTEATMYRTKLNECEITGTPPPWTYEQLSGVLAVALRKVPEVKEVAATEQPLVLRPAKCPCCGLPGHPASLCPTSCSTCGERSCPGNHGEKCVVGDPAPVPAVVQNAKGWPMPSEVRTRLVRAHEKFHSAKKEISHAEIDPEIADAYAEMAQFFPDPHCSACEQEVSHAAAKNVVHAATGPIDALDVYAAMATQLGVGA